MRSRSQHVNTEPAGESGHLGDYIRHHVIFSQHREHLFRGQRLLIANKEALFQPAAALCLLS